ncbi:MAG: hypothetical protein AAFV74_09365 [Pseudomonadota bacterium]
MMFQRFAAQRRTSSMSISELFETLMLACFSLGWYWSIFAMICTGRPYGKSLVFVCFTVLGYCLGLSAHLIDWSDGEPLSYLVFMYGLNLGVTLVDLGLLWVLSQRPDAAVVLSEQALSDKTDNFNKVERSAVAVPQARYLANQVMYLSPDTASH